MIKLSLYLATMLLGSNFAASTAPKTSAEARIGTALVEQRFVDLANSERVNRGLGTLEVSPLLAEVAREHSKEMWRKDYFDHISPTPELKTPMTRYLKWLGHRPKWARLGENLFYCSIVDTDRGHKCLMGSAAHRENILDGRYEQIGVGAYVAPDGRLWVTQLFLTQKD
jgi:uncharacterized protein YkwD